MLGRVLSPEWRRKYPSAPYLIPFAAFAAFLIFTQRAAAEPLWRGPLRVIVLGGICAVCWPREIPLRPVHWLLSTLLGLLVFVLWITPETIMAGYRDALLFSNPITGRAHVSTDPTLLNKASFLFWRVARAVLVVPIVEELFWRAWLMRWLISSNIEQTPLGAYSPFAFWMTAILFASEHGPYWDVGLLTGVIYNSWMIRTKSVADCVLMHAVTNGALSAYVIATRQWQYWQ